MMNFKVSRFIFLLPLTISAFVLACESYSRDEINALIETDNPNNLVKAFYLIGENRDSLYIPIILTNANDPRIAHASDFKGISVYQSKMIALKKISGLDPPLKITYKPDSMIVEFYRDWARQSDLLNNLH